MQAVSTQFPKMGKKDAVLVMAHGTPHPSNAYYAVMQDRLNELGFNNVYIFSVEGWPHLETVMPQLKAKGIKNVTLMPLMMVAGDHANNDMAGDDEDSWKSMFNASGAFESVDCQIAGLGGIEAIQRNEDGSINLGNFLKYTNAADNGTDTPAGSDTSITTPDTGDRVMKVLVPLIIVMVIAVAGIVYVAVSSKKKKEDK